MPILLLAVAYMMINAKREQDAASARTAPVPVYVPPASSPTVNPKPSEDSASGYFSACLAGGAFGASVGSVVPGYGTAIGAGAGCLTGIGVTLYDRWD